MKNTFILLLGIALFCLSELKGGEIKQACDISASVTNTSCRNQATTLPTDDTHDVTILVTNSTGSSFQVVENGNVIESGSYGTPKTIFGLSSGSHTLTIRDVLDGSCSTTLSLNLTSCSPECTLGTSFNQLPCTTSGIPVEVTVSGSTGQNWMIKLKRCDGSEVLLTSGSGNGVQQVTIPYSATCGGAGSTGATLWVFWSDYTDCLQDYTNLPCNSGQSCSSSISASPGSCNTSTNQYTLTGSVTFSNAPTSGTMTVSVSGGGSQVFNAPFTSPQSYSINNLTSDGASHTVSVSFSADGNCSSSQSYTAPSSCQGSSCNISASITNAQCRDQATTNQTDDNYDVTIVVNNSGGTTFQVVENGIVIENGSYGVPKTIFGVSLGSHTFTIRDALDNNCSTSLQATYTTCSPTCTLDASFNQLPCTTSGIPVDVTIGGSTGKSWMIKLKKCDGSEELLTSGSGNGVQQVTIPYSATCGGAGSTGATLWVFWSDYTDCLHDWSNLSCNGQTCSISVTGSPSSCNTSTNQYTLTGSITFSNAPTSGTLTVSVSGGGNQVFNAPFTSPQNYSIGNLLSDGASHTVSAVFSADPNCTSSTTYTAPQSCSNTNCSVSLSADPGICSSSTNQYSLYGTVTFNNAPTSGSMTISVSGGGSRTFFAPFTSPQSYTINNLIADGALHTVTVVFSAAPNCTNSTSYTAPEDCSPSLCTLDVTASAGLCNTTTNQYTVSGQITFVNPPTTGTLTVTVVGGGNQVFNAPFTSPQNYSIGGLPADGAIHTVSASFSDDGACNNTTIYTAPNSCSPQSCSVTLTASPGLCNPANNQYTLTGTITLINPPTSGTMTVSVSGGGSQVFNAPFTSPQNYSIGGLTADGASHTVTVAFNTTSICSTTRTYTAPSSCAPQPCTVSLTAVPTSCTPSTNQYTLTGTVTFSNAPTSGTMTVSVSGGGNQVFNAPFTSPQNYSIGGLTSNGANQVVTVTFSAASTCTNTANYTAPNSCTGCPPTQCGTTTYFKN